MQNKQNDKAFSLIELSIVLIIIGLLVAGITGSQALIENAKIQATTNQLNSFKQAFYTFKSLKNRLPGDLNNSGFVGAYSTQSYNNNSFGGNYVSSNQEYGIPATKIAPFVELFLEGIIKYEPKKYIPSNQGLNEKNGGSPKPKNMNCDYYFEVGETHYDKNSTKFNMKKKTFVVCYKVPSQLKNSFLKKIDEKIDDGEWNGGDFRTWGGDYLKNINKLRQHFYYGVE